MSRVKKLKLATQRQQDAEAQQSDSGWHVSELLLDVVGLAAWGSIVFGTYQLSQPVAFIVGGTLMLALVILASRK